MLNGTNLIDGAWVDSDHHSASADLEGQSFAQATAAQVDTAAQAARRDFRAYAGQPRQARAAFLRRIAQEIDARHLGHADVRILLVDQVKEVAVIDLAWRDRGLARLARAGWCGLAREARNDWWRQLQQLVALVGAHTAPRAPRPSPVGRRRCLAPGSPPAPSPAASPCLSVTTCGEGESGR